MCLAIPGRILSMTGDDPLMRVGRVDFGGIVKEINLAYVPEAGIGDHVLVHVGFAITVIDEAEAARVFEHLREIEDLLDAEAEDLTTVRATFSEELDPATAQAAAHYSVSGASVVSAAPVAKSKGPVTS